MGAMQQLQLHITSRDLPPVQAALAGLLCLHPLVGDCG